MNNNVRHRTLITTHTVIASTWIVKSISDAQKILIPQHSSEIFKRCQTHSSGNIFVRIRIGNIANFVETYKRQSEIHKFEIPPEVLQGKDIPKIVQWMSNKVDEISGDRATFPDWVTGCIYKVSLILTKQLG